MNMQLMKRTVTALGVAGLVMGTLGCSQDQSGQSGAGDSAQVKPYPLEVCIVAGEPLGSMGEPVVMVHEGQQVKFCCKECIKEFEEDPAKFLTKLKPSGSVE